MRYFLRLFNFILIFFFFVNPAYAEKLPTIFGLDRSLSIEETDGSPSLLDCSKIQVPPGTLSEDSANVAVLQLISRDASLRQLSADSISADALWVNGYLYPTNAPTIDGSIISWDATSGRFVIGTIVAGTGNVTSVTEGVAGPLELIDTSSAVKVSIASADASTAGYISAVNYADWQNNRVSGDVVKAITEGVAGPLVITPSQGYQYPTISIQSADSSTSGYISATNFNTWTNDRVSQDAVLNTLTLGTPLADASVADDITLTNITQITNRNHTNLTSIGNNTHSQIDSQLQILTDDAVIQDEKLSILSNDAITQNASISTNTTALTNRVSQDAVLNTLTVNTPIADTSIADDITLTNITQVTNKSHTSLSDIGTNTHLQIDSQLQILTDDAIAQDEKLNIISSDTSFVTYYSLPKVTPTVTGSVISWDGAILKWGTIAAAGGGAGTVTSVTEGVAGPLELIDTTSAVKVSIASADASTAGYISSVNYNDWQNNRVSQDAILTTLSINTPLNVASGGTNSNVGYTVVSNDVSDLKTKTTIISSDAVDWETAFGWGDHSLIGYLTANQNITLSGNVSGSGTTGITVTISDDAVTYAKMQNVSAADKVLGRFTAGAGDVEEIACTAAGRALIDDANAAAQLTTLGAASKALDNLASVAINTTLGDVLMNEINSNTLLVAPTSTYTTITLAMNAATAGDTILVSEGTYTEAVTFSQDNITLKAIGSKANTIITQAAATVVNFSTKSGCVLEGFTIIVSAADGTADYCITGTNDDTSDYNIVKDCDINWATTNAINAYSFIYITDGNWEFSGCNFSVDDNYVGVSNNASIALYIAGAAGHTVKFIHCNYTADWENTLANNRYGIYAVGIAKLEIRDCTFDFDDEATTTALCRVIVPDGVTNTYLYNNHIDVNVNGTGNSYALATLTSGTTHSYNNTYDASNADNDSQWANVAASTTLNSHGDTIIDGTLSNAGTANIYSTTTEGDLYVFGNMSALSITDRTPAFEGNAIEAIKNIKSIDGKIDHSTLPEFVKSRKRGKAITEKQIIDGEERDVVVGYEENIERNISNMISVNVKAIQQLTDRIETLEKE